MRSFFRSKSTFFLGLTMLVCLVGGLFFSYQSCVPVNPDQVTKQFTDNLDGVVENIDFYGNQYINQWMDTQSLTMKRIGSIDFFTVINQEIAQWTGNQYIPGTRQVAGDFKLKHIKTGAGDFLVRKWSVSSSKFLVAVIPLHINYKIQNEYLGPQWNEDIFSDYQVQVLDISAAGGNSVHYKGSILFKYQLLPGYVSDLSAGVVATILFTLLIITFFIFLFRFNRHFIRNSPAISFLLLTISMVVVRYVMVTLQFPSRYIDLTLFDPKYFASSFLNPSMGDLFLNSVGVVVLCLFLFLNFFRFEPLRPSLRKVYLRWLLSVFSSVAILFGSLFPFVVIQTIYNNSAISLNISQSIYFDSLRTLAFASVVLAWLSAFLWIHVFTRILMSDTSWKRVTISLMVGSLIFIVINSWSGQLYISSMSIGLGYTMLVIGFRLYKSLQQFHYTTFVYFFLAVIAFSLNGLVALVHFSGAKKAQDQLRFANTFLIDRDDFGEFLLDEAIRKISSDLFIQTRLSGPFVNKEAVKQKVRQVFIPRYFNKYNTEIHLFGPLGDPMEEGKESYSDWMSENITRATSTLYDGVYFMSKPDFELTRKYFAVAPIKRNDISMGYIVLEFSLKRIIPDNVYPDLLVDNRFQQGFHAQEFSYAVFDRSSILFRSGDFNYNTLDLSMLYESKLYRDGILSQNFRHVGSKDASGRTVIVSAPLPGINYIAADFSFLTIVGLMTVLFYLLFVGLSSFLNKERLMMTARIQLILNVSFFIPLIGVSIIIIGLTARSNQQQLNSEYLAKARNFSNENSSVLGDQELVSVSEYEQTFTQLSKLSNLDANLYSPTGKLQVSSQPLIFENQLLAPLINPIALQRILSGDRAFILDEKVGKLDYFVAYSAIYSPKNGALIGIAAIPFFQSAYLLEKMQITVLSNVLSLFTGIFIVLLIISYWVSKWLTFPLRMITQKLGRISLTQSNQPVEWHSDDEIGLMVREYNKMLSSLSESKNELERTQRERAWREIAQQVAHEIKNPLTPMKLTLQKLEKLSDDDPQKFEKFKNSISSILSQVDTLDGVASSFSTFAKMPQPVMGQVELIDLVRNVINLHNQSATIEFRSDISHVLVLADAQLLTRILSNIILNAKQATQEGNELKIEVSIVKTSDKILMSFSDNGIGIDDPVKEKIFLPHFTTKQAGSGLGLAIAKQGIEQMGGRIYFESELGKGTIFYIELPELYV